jgi:hypothetical protein
VDRSPPPGVGTSQTSGVSRDSWALSSGPCTAHSPPAEHFRQRLLDDADDRWDLGPVWSLDGDW